MTSTSPATIGRGSVGKTVSIPGQYIGQQTMVSISGVTITSTKWVNYQQIDVTVTVPAAASPGYHKVALYNPYSDSYGYYGYGSCRNCVAVT